MPELMKEKGLSQADTARLIDVSEGFISRVINLDKHFSIRKAKRAAKLFNITIDELWEWED